MDSCQLVTWWGRLEGKVPRIGYIVTRVRVFSVFKILSAVLAFYFSPSPLDSNYQLYNHKLDYKILNGVEIVSVTSRVFVYKSFKYELLVQLNLEIEKKIGFYLQICDLPRSQS